MDSPNKRVLTDELRESSSASDHFSRSSSAAALPDDLLQRLRSIGARGRKSVLEGYRTTPSSFSRAQSAGSIFSSMSDTLQQVYSNASTYLAPTQNNSSRKRSHSVTDHDIDDRDGIPDDAETVEEQNTADVLENPVSCRPIKPLRSRARRPLLETRSLPAEAFSFGTNDWSSEVQSPGTVGNKVEEEDWSQEGPLQSAEQSFEPMIF